jgi:co-chaperonin GroES (HSP10)
MTDEFLDEQPPHNDCDTTIATAAAAQSPYPEPVGNRVLVRKITAGTHEDELLTQLCEVVAVSATLDTDVSHRLVEGARVYIAPHRTAKIDIDGTELFVVAADDVLAVERT